MFSFLKKEEKKEIAVKDHNKFKVAINGIMIVFKNESSFRYQSLLLFIAVILGIILKLSFYEWTIVAVMSTVVLCCEALNTSIEYLLDMISPEYNVLVGRIKDVTAGVVLLASLGAIIVGILIYYPKIKTYL